MIPASSGYEWLAVAGLVRDPHVLQISWKPLAHLLLHNVQDQITRIFGDKLARHDHFQEAAELPDCAVAEIDARVLDGVTKMLAEPGRRCCQMGSWLSDLRAHSYSWDQVVPSQVQSQSKSENCIEVWVTPRLCM